MRIFFAGEEVPNTSIEQPVEVHSWAHKGFFAL